MDYIIRKACESDKLDIARTIAHSFEKITSLLSKDKERVARIIENGIVSDRFYVAEQNSLIIGVIGCADYSGRIFKLNRLDFRKYLGFIRGSISFKILSNELMRPHAYPATTGVIDIVGVLEQVRGKGVAKKMMETIMENNPQYSDFILDVASDNPAAIKSYTDFGFVEFDRISYMFIKTKKIFMRYTVI